MLEYWKKIFGNSWDVYRQNFAIIMGATFLSFLPLGLMFFLPAKGQEELAAQSELGLFSVLNLYSSLELLFMLAIIMLFGGMIMGLFNMIYQMIQGKKVAIKDLPKKIHVFPKIILPYFIFFIMILLMERLNLTIIGDILGLFFGNIMILYIMLVLTENSSMITSVYKLRQIIQNNILYFVQFVFINMVMQWFLILTMLVFLLAPILLIPFIMIINVQFFINIKSPKL